MNDRHAPPGKFRVIADDYGRWSRVHSDILVGDFDTMEQAHDAAQPWLNKPREEHWTVTIFDDAGRFRGDTKLLLRLCR